MSKSDSSSESSSSYSDDSSDFEVEDETCEDAKNIRDQDKNKASYAYDEEPIASEEWVSAYLKKQEEKSELEKELLQRLRGDTPTSDWCKCKNCATTHLENISECYCCTELDGCVECLQSEEILQELAEADKVLSCVTQHPGFRTACLDKWHLRLSADKYRKRNKETYKQTGSEEKFLRSLAYREFTRLIYGFLGKKRYPLPACAYNKVRIAFQSNCHTGFIMDN